MNAQMVRATLAGAKTVTRRLVTPQPTRSLPNTKTIASEAGALQFHHPLGWQWQRTKSWSAFAADGEDFGACLAPHNPYGQTGDRLYVRETFAMSRLCNGYIYRADLSPEQQREEESARQLCRRTGATPSKWTPSMNMPKQASRLRLEVVGVSAERLQDITEP